MNVFLAKFDPDFLIFLVFIMLPILGRVMRALGKKGEEKVPAPRKARPDGSAAERRSGDMADLERQGREAWKRLLEGLGPQEDTQPEVVHVPEEPAPPVAPVAPPVSRAQERKEHEDVARTGLPSEGGKQPPPPPRQPEPALVQPHRRPQLAVPRSEAEDLRTTMRRTARRDTVEVSPALLSGADLRRAVLWSEILSPPVALRSADGRAPGLREG